MSRPPPRFTRTVPILPSPTFCRSTGRAMARGMLAGIFGALLGTGGTNTAGYTRGTMGIDWLFDGIPVIPAMMGLLAASQLLNLINTHYLIEDEANREISFKSILQGVRHPLSYPTIMIRGFTIGVIIGAIPGVGVSISHSQAHRRARNESARPCRYRWSPSHKNKSLNKQNK